MGRLVRAVGRAGIAGTGAGAGALAEGKSPLSSAVGAGLGEALAPVITKPLGWVGGKIANKFEMGGYIGKIGEKLQNVFQMEKPIKTRQDLYNALHLGEAGEAIGAAYRKAHDTILGAVGADAPITGREAYRLNKLFYDNVPEFRGLVDDVVDRATTKVQIPGVSRYSSFKRMPATAPSRESIANEFLAEPLAVQDAMENARLLGSAAAKSQKGAGGFGIREANREARKAISGILDNMKPGENWGAAYSDMNFKYYQGNVALKAFDPNELFKLSAKGGAQWNEIGWTKASNAALKKLKDAQLEGLDTIIRRGLPPGYVATESNLIGGSMHPPTGVTGLRAFLPHIKVETPLRPAPGTASRIAGAGARATTADIGEQLSED
jgi:hypothetical protein